MITVRRRTNLAHRAAGTRGVLLALLLGAFAVACQDTISPTDGLKPQFAQGADGVWIVNSTADPGDGVCDDTECTLREAIFYAQPGDRITFAPEVTGTITLTAGELRIDRPLTVVGPGANDLAIDANWLSRVFLIHDPVTEAAVVISGLTIEHGSSEDNGGGVLNEETLTLNDALVTDNWARYYGGGITNGGALTLMNTTVSDNTSDGFGGGIAHAGLVLGLLGSTVAWNGAKGGGGAIYAVSSGGTILVRRTTISQNGGMEDMDEDGVLVSTALIVGHSTIIDRIVLEGPGASATYENTIVGGDCAGGLTSMTSLGHNVLAACDLVAPTSSDIVLTGTQLFTDVLEQELKDNGGPTQTHALLAGGHAVDAGLCPTQTEDQRGFARPVDDPFIPNAVDGCDIGAYEMQGPFVPVADLMVSQAVDKTSVKQGQLLTYSIRVQNLSPRTTAPNVVMNDVLSSGVTFVSADAKGKGTFTAPNKGETGTVTWYLGDMLGQANEVAEIVVTVLVKGKTTITNTASVTGDVADPNGANNAASITVSVGAGGGGGGGGGKKK